MGRIEANAQSLYKFTPGAKTGQVLDLTLPIIFTPPQEIVEASKARFKIIKAGRRFGKTLYSLVWLVKRACMIPDVDHWYVAPTYKLAYEVAWRELLKIIPKELIVKIKTREMMIELFNGAKIFLKSSDNEIGLLGRKLGSLVIDEAAFQKHHIWPDILRPMLVDLQAPALIISTPKRGWFTKLFDFAESGKDPDWEAFHFTIYDNPHINRQEIEKLRLHSSDRTWQEQYMAQETDESGQVYLEFSNSNIYNSMQRFTRYREWPCVVGIDWGFGDDTAVLWLHISPEGYIVAANEHLRSGWSVNRHASIIAMKNRGLIIDHGNYVLDRSAFRTAEGSMTIADQFKREGIICQRSVKDINIGVDNMKRFLRGDGETPWLYISSSLKNTIHGFQDWEYDSHEPDALAALRYGLVHVVRLRLTKLVDAPGAFASNTKVEPKREVLHFYPDSYGEDGDNQWDWDAGVPY